MSFNDEWEVVKLEELIDITHGYAFKGKFFSDSETNIILLTPGNFKIGGGFKGQKLKYYKEDGELPEDYILESNDLIVTMTDLSKNADTLGYPAFVPESNKIFLHNQRLGKVIVKNSEKINKKYLYYKMCTREYRHEVLASSTGTTVHHSAPDRILNFSFKLPKMEEQKAISNILSSLDKKIELNNQMNQTLEKIAQAIYKNWFIDFEPFQDEEFVESELGMIPEGWEKGRISEIIDITLGNSPKSDTYNEKREGLPLLNGASDFENGVPSTNRYSSKPKRIAKEGEIILCTRGTIGNVSYADQDYCIGRGVSSMKVKNKEYKEFAYYTLKHHIYRLTQQASGSVIKGLTKSDMLNIPIVKCPHNIIKKYHEIINPINKKQSNILKENIILKALRDILLPKLMSGELRVESFEKERG